MKKVILSAILVTGSAALQAQPLAQSDAHPNWQNAWQSHGQNNELYGHPAPVMPPPMLLPPPPRENEPVFLKLLDIRNPYGPINTVRT